MYFWGMVGIALGSSIASWYNVFLLYIYAKKLGKFEIVPTMFSFFLKCLLNCAIMSLVIFFAAENYGVYLNSESVSVKSFSLILLIIIGGGVFFAGSFLCGLFKIILKP